MRHPVQKENQQEQIRVHTSIFVELGRRLQFSEDCSFEMKTI